MVSLHSNLKKIGQMTFTTSKRAEARLTLVKPLQIASKCASGTVSKFIGF